MLSIPVKLDLDAGAAEAALKNFERGAKDALQEIVELNGKKVNIDFKFSTSGEPVVKELNDQQAALKRTTDAYNRLSGGQENSIGRTKKVIAQFKKQRDSLAVNSKEFKIASAAVRKFEDQLRALQGVQKGSVADLKLKRARLIELRDAVKLNSPEYKRLTAEIDKFDAALKGNNAQLDKSTKKTLGFVNVFAKIAIVSAGIQSISAALRSVGNAIDVYTRRTKDVEGFNLAVQNVGFSQAETTRIFNQAERTASALGAPLQQVEKSYRRMVPALKAVGTSAEDSDKFIEAISARSQTLGLNTEQSGRLLEAFAQVLSKGKLQAEELNQQISELDGAFRTQLADALGVTSAQLEEMISNSEVTADVFVKAVNNMANGVEALRARVVEGNLTIQQFQNIISNIETKNIEVIGKAIEPAIKSFLAIRLAVADFIKEFVKSPQFFMLATTFNGIAKGVENFVKSLLNTLNVIGMLTGTLTQIINFVLSLDAGFGGLVGVLTQFTLVLGATNAALILATKTKIIYAAAAKKLGENALFASLGLKATFVAAAKLAGPLTLALVGINLVSEAFKRGTKKGAEFDAELTEIEERMKNIASFSPGTTNGIQRFFENVFGFIARMGDPETTGAFSNIQSQINRVGAIAEGMSSKIRKLGIDFKDLGSFTDVSTNDIKEFASQLKQQDKANKKALKTAEARLANLREQEPHNNTLIDLLERQIKQLKAEVKVNEQRIPVLDKVLTLRGEDIEATEKQIDLLKEFKDATDRSISENSLKALEARTDAIKELGHETELLAAANLGIDQAQSEADLSVYQRELQLINQLGTSMNGLAEEEKARAIELTTLIAQERNKQAQLSLDAQAAVIAGFERGVDRVNQKVQVIGQSASALQSSFDATTSNFVSGLQTATSLIDTVVSREIEGLEVGSKKRKDIITAQLKAQARAIQTENTLAQLKLTVQSQIAQSEARIQQGQYRVLAAQARMQGNDGLAQTLDDAASAQNQIISALQIQEQVERRILNINKQNQQQALIDKGIKEELADSAKEVAKKIGVQVVSLKGAVKEQRIIDNLVKEYSKKMAGAAINAQELKEETQKTTMREGESSAQAVRDALRNAKDNASTLGATMDSVNGSFESVEKTGGRIVEVLSKANREARNLINLTKGGGPARALGGPVTGGQQYTVNDGGGREAFLSNTGKFSMLPAARNIQWTAPSSGTIISAKVLKAMQRNQSHNSAITNARVEQGPIPKLMAATAITSDSGSLAKQISSAMSGSSSNRITNNVTIQSQSPVNDASDLMTNVARMRLRNSRRF